MYAADDAQRRPPRSGTVSRPTTLPQAAPDRSDFTDEGMRVDLHLHSTASDGSVPAGDLVRQARNGGLDVIALADHDTTAGIDAARNAGRGSIHVISAIEISTTLENEEIHVLGYYIDHTHPTMVEHERLAIQRRRQRMEAILHSLGSEGIDLQLADVEAEAGIARVVARPHLARVLVSRGHAHSVSDAFDRWIGDACPAYRAIDLTTPEDAIARIHQAGGIAAWAHPAMDSFERNIDRFTEWGLDAVECFRPRSSHENTRTLETAARRRGLLLTGGSDWHGPWSGRLGQFSVGPDEIGAFLERGGI
jgi:predicted metal-dependent phosphoesterase TrpH